MHTEEEEELKKKGGARGPPEWLEMFPGMDTGFEEGVHQMCVYKHTKIEATKSRLVRRHAP